MGNNSVFVNYKDCKEWYLGLDIGTDSIGWAVTNESYRVLKYMGNAMWGVMLFDGGNTSAERRGHRTDRRRLQRRKQRIDMLQELFADEIAKKDKNFYVRLKESALYKEDKSLSDECILFNNCDMSDKEYYSKYPTIHHLICELMENKEYHDVRLVYMACAYILSHRGHFLKEVDKNNIKEVIDFNKVYDDFTTFYSECYEVIPWECNGEDFRNILKENISITAKEKKFKELLWKGKKAVENDDVKVSVNVIVKLLSGGKVKLSDLFKNNDYRDIENNSFSIGTDNFDEVISSISSVIDEDETELILKIKALYDWSVLAEILAGCGSISEAKRKIYNIHKEDVKNLKKFIRKYIPEKYNEVFREVSDKANYTRYVHNAEPEKITKEKYEKATAEDFCKYIKGIVKGAEIEDEDMPFYNDMMARLETKSFCPKQKTGDNRVIPYQLYWVELKQILDNASEYLSFLNESDEYGTVKDKILSIMEFRVPYYVGPLVSENKSKFAWMVRKNEGKIYPWNFDDMVDRDKSEKAFIRRMTCKCTYIAGEDILPKNSLLYSKFNVLNEINNIKINDKPISTECKQRIFEELFMERKKVSLKVIKDFLISNNYMENDDKVSGIDTTIKSSLQSYNDFKRLMRKGILNEDDVERIIERITLTKEKKRIKKWLKTEFKMISEDDINYISGLKYDDFGRLSLKFLTGIKDIDRETGEIKNPSVIDMMWQKNINLMQLLSYEYSYMYQIENMNREYYSENEFSLNDKLDSMYISNAVKRPIIRCLDIVKELKEIMSCPPKKIFVEMARGSNEEQKGKRSKSRRDKIKELYDNYEHVCSENEIRELRELLECKSDRDLRRDELYLYFIQFGRSMYSNTVIDIEKLGTKVYDIDHIYPQSRVKDDSIDNRVLVLTEENENKKDKYPISEEIRRNMHYRWENLYKIGAISEKKLKRLERNSGFTDEELADFINRQIVETRQSTKAVASLLKDMFENTEIVYVKAGLVSDFRHEFDILKSREVNDLHHGKDAYLNIVMGNVYNVKFTKNPLNFIKEKGGKGYSMKLKSLLKYDIVRGGEIAWKGNGETFNTVKEIMNKNNLRFVRYAKERKGELFNAQPLRKGHGQVPIKGNSTESIKKYGGYKSAAIAYFYLIRYTEKKKRVISLQPIEIYMAERLDTIEKVIEYCENTLNKENTEILLNGRKIKIDSLWEIDGFRAHLSSKSNNYVKFKGGMQLIVGYKWEYYIKKLNIFKERYVRSNKTIRITEYDIVSEEKNIELYDLLTDKINNTQYKILLKTAAEVLSKGKEKFIELTTEEQTVVLSNILMLFRCNSPDGTDLRDIGGVKNSGIRIMNMEINGKRFSEIYIIDQSPTGLREKKSPNLIEL